MYVEMAVDRTIKEVWVNIGWTGSEALGEFDIILQADVITLLILLSIVSG